MGQAKRRGPFEERRAQAICRRERELAAYGAARAADHPRPPVQATPRQAFPLAVALAWANAFEFRRRSWRGSF